MNPMTTVCFGLAENSRVRLAIYDVRGRLVRTLVNGEMPAGSHRTVWNGRNDRGRQVSSGVYFCRMTAGEFRQSQKIMVVR